ncbi:sce7726 family protein [Hydrocarboniphaga effusa]|uniref:Uncharacterized protein n=1 Tax=Hydrocarboniphaga effusa AP103 TaxID=1172194 RepID=I7ZJU3_9GAMM|nr:sce7726 family protein [Hydrocarboniphaga effusa]EIT72007.1 hypothetical protein WQQ_21440 [Hydrocarboniphaga effusa AP103]
MENAMSARLNKLAELFSAASFRDLAVVDSPAFVRAIVDDAGKVNLGRRMKVRLMFDRAYELLLEHYRFEYIYKNAITQQLLLNKHTLDNGPLAARLLTEFVVGEVRADIAVMNGTSTVYEVKSSYDTLNRLPNQLRWYSKLFDHINVVTADEMVDDVLRGLPDYVGVLVLNHQGQIEERVPAKSNKANLDLRIAFLAMRERELIAIARQRFGIEESQDSVVLAACWESFKALAPEEAHGIMVETLRQRAIHPAQIKLIESAPGSLKHHSIAKIMNIGHWRALVPQLDVVI